MFEGAECYPVWSSQSFIILRDPLVSIFSQYLWNDLEPLVPNGDSVHHWELLRAVLPKELSSGTCSPPPPATLTSDGRVRCPAIRRWTQERFPPFSGSSAGAAFPRRCPDDRVARRDPSD